MHSYAVVIFKMPFDPSASICVDVWATGHSNQYGHKSCQTQVTEKKKHEQITTTHNRKLQPIDKERKQRRASIIKSMFIWFFAIVDTIPMKFRKWKWTALYLCVVFHTYVFCCLMTNCLKTTRTHNYVMLISKWIIYNAYISS